MIGLHRLPLIEQRTLDEWGTVSFIGVGIAGGRLIQSAVRPRASASRALLEDGAEGAYVVA
jgi:hypothetical protein